MTSILQKAVLYHLEMVGPKDYANVAEKAGVKKQWMRQLANGDIVDAGADKLEKLHTYFTGNAHPVSN